MTDPNKDAPSRPPLPRWVLRFILAAALITAAFAGAHVLGFAPSGHLR